MNTNLNDEKIVEEIRKKINNRTFDDNTFQHLNQTDLDKQSQEKIQKYLDNLFFEYNFQCFSEKSGDGCHRLANFYENFRKDFEKANEIYKKSCDDLKFPRSCITYSKNKSLGRGCSKDLFEACKYNFISCDLDDSDGCLNAGICLSEGIGGFQKNLSEAIKYFEKSCEAKNSISCLRLFKLYLEGDANHGINRDPFKAYLYTKRACEYNDFLGCSNASLMLRKGDGIAKDIKLADELKKKALKIKDEQSDLKKHIGIVMGEQHK